VRQRVEYGITTRASWDWVALIQKDSPVAMRRRLDSVTAGLHRLRQSRFEH